MERGSGRVEKEKREKLVCLFGEGIFHVLDMNGGTTLGHFRPTFCHFILFSDIFSCTAWFLIAKNDDISGRNTLG